MPTITTHNPTSFYQLIHAVEKFQSAHESTWFRGVADANYKLIPTLFRHPKIKKIEEISALEKEIANTFQQKSPPFVSQNFNDDWDRMFYMQHYGIPTRLLDWSESPFVGLYFALASCVRDAKGAPKKDCVLWMLDPIMWNRSALSDISFSGGILDSKQEQVKGYRPSADLDERKNIPVMIHGTHNSVRIVAQRGTFSLFGKEVKSIEEIYKGGTFISGTIEKILISKKHRDDIMRSLINNGFSDSTIFPDLHGLSLEINRNKGFYI